MFTAGVEEASVASFVVPGFGFGAASDPALARLRLHSTVLQVKQHTTTAITTKGPIDRAI